jgi:hypothetical protein
MYDQKDDGLGFMEGFALLAGALWIGGALFVIILIQLGAARMA